jgi:hypothetical protein
VQIGNGVSDAAMCKDVKTAYSELTVRIMIQDHVSEFGTGN